MTMVAKEVHDGPGAVYTWGKMGTTKIAEAWQQGVHHVAVVVKSVRHWLRMCNDNKRREAEATRRFKVTMHKAEVAGITVVYISTPPDVSRFSRVEINLLV